MKCRVLLLALFLSSVLPMHGAQSVQRPSDKTWYERVLGQINPNDTDYGAIWEERKKAFMGRIGSPCFQFGFAATLTIVWLFIVLFAQHVSHRRKENWQPMPFETFSVMTLTHGRRHETRFAVTTIISRLVIA